MQSHNERIADLLEANNRLVAERDAALAEAEHYKESVDFLLRHNGMAEMRRLRTENRQLSRERDDAMHEKREIASQLAILADRVDEDKPIVMMARKWAQSIHALRRAMKINESGKKGNVLEANRAYTEAHVSMLALTPDTSDK